MAYLHSDTRRGPYAPQDCPLWDNSSRDGALAHGDDPLMRIALCGYDGEHVMPDTWTAVPWKARGGYGTQGTGRGRENASREVVWFSPHCLSSARPWILAASDAIEGPGTVEQDGGFTDEGGA